MSKGIKVAFVTGGNRGIGYELVKEEAMSGTNIRVTNVSPGAVSSELLKRFPMQR